MLERLIWISLLAAAIAGNAMARSPCDENPTDPSTWEIFQPSTAPPPSSPQIMVPPPGYNRTMACWDNVCW